MAKFTFAVALLIASSASQSFAQDRVQAVLSAGVSALRDDHEDFTKNNGALLVSNDSKKRASGLAGALFRLGAVDLWGMQRQISVHTSLQFTQGAQSFLDGFFFGGAFQLNEHLHFTVGIGLNKGKELSPGFRASAASVIAERVAANDPAYARFAGYGPEARDEALLDGLPLNTPGKETPFFPGDPIVDSYNWSYFAGISVPVAVTEMFKKKDDPAKSVQAPSSKDAERRAR